MRCVALLAAVPLLVVACGNDAIELKAERTVDGRVARMNDARLPREIRALSATSALLHLVNGTALATRDGGRRWRPARWRPDEVERRPPVPLPAGAKTAQVCRSAFFHRTRGLLICGGVPGAGNQWKRFWSWSGSRWTKLAEGPSYGYVGDLDALAPRAYVHHSGRAGDLITVDGGRTWRAAFPAESSAIGSWVTPRTGWAVNGHGDVFRTRDGGRHWRFAGPRFWPRGETSFCTPRIGYGTGTPDVGGYSADRTVYATSDAGRTWNRRSRLKLAAGTLTCVGRNVVILSAYPPLNAKRQEPHLLRSRDGGRTWRRLRVPRGAYPPQVHTRDVYFAPRGDRDGWITFDGARTWRKIRAGAALQSIAFTTPRLGFAVLLRTVGLKRTRTWLVSTDDAGETWRRVPTTLRNFAPTTVIAAHGTVWVRAPQRVLRTRDGGRYWDEIRISGFPPDARFASPTLGVASGSLGVLVTRDGGVTWRWRGAGYS